MCYSQTLSRDEIVERQGCRCIEHDECACNNLQGRGQPKNLKGDEPERLRVLLERSQEVSCCNRRRPENVRTLRPAVQSDVPAKPRPTRQFKDAYEPTLVQLSSAAY